MTEFTSDDPKLRAVITAINEAAEAAITKQGFEGQERLVALAMALTICVWEGGSRDGRVPQMATGALMNMFVDAGLGEKIGLHINAEPEKLH